MMEKKRSAITTIFVFALILFLLNGCESINVFNIFRRVRVKKKEVPFAHKWDEREKVISVGMSKEEVINTWGEPPHIYEGFWVYTKKKEVPTARDISYEVYFEDEKVIKIIEIRWSKRLLEWH